MSVILNPERRGTLVEDVVLAIAQSVEATIAKHGTIIGYGDTIEFAEGSVSWWMRPPSLVPLRPLQPDGFALATAAIQSRERMLAE